MTSEFLFFANLVLALRLVILLRDPPQRPLNWSLKSLLELLTLAVFEFSLPIVWLGLSSVLLNVLAAPGRRFRSPGLPVHLALGAVQLLSASVWLAPGQGVEFRPEVLALADPLREASALAALPLALLERDALIVMLGLLLAANEANLLIRWLLARLSLRPSPDASRPLNAVEFQRGRVIGLIERAMIYAFVLTGEYGAVGFVLAAKGFSRARDLKQDDRDFTEYVIIGTLVSSGLAMLCAAMVRWAL